MATSRRMIATDIFEDQFIGGSSFFERLCWIGLFTVCADDQGRCADNPAIIRSKVFPFDRNVDDLKVNGALEKAAKAGKLVRYVAQNGICLLQIVKWWQYQTPSWASPSKYPPPDGWMDKCKYHTKGNKIIIENWETAGGFVRLGSALGSTLPSRIEDVNGDGDGDGEADIVQPPEKRPLIYTLYESNIGPLTPLVSEKLTAAASDYPEDWIKMAFQESVDHNARNWSYIVTILKRWKAEGFQSKKNGKESKTQALQDNNLAAAQAVLQKARLANGNG